MIKPKIILGIETSCDETAASICRISAYGKPTADEGVQILSNVVASSADLQAKYGGVIPEQAAREQLKSVIPVIREALQQAFPNVIPSKEGIYNMDPRLRGDDIVEKIDAIAVTQGPGLIGSLLVGVETAKTLATIWQKPLIPVNHLLGHFYANWVDMKSSRLRSNNNYSSSEEQSDESRSSITPAFPCIGLLVSGGHTDLILFTDHGKFKYLGGTRDDAAGECFDKCARLLDLPYPGGPNLSKLAEKGNPKAYKLPRPMLDSKDLDFSFSGLKTAVYNLLENKGVLSLNSKEIRRGVTRVGVPHAGVPRLLVKWETHGAGEWQDPEHLKANLAASIENAITDVLVKKTVRAIQTYHVDQLIIAGGVAANKILTKKLIQSISEFSPRARIFIPPPSLCTDNAVSTATCAFYNFKPVDPLKLQANPNLSLSD